MIKIDYFWKKVQFFSLFLNQIFAIRLCGNPSKIRRHLTFSCLSNSLRTFMKILRINVFSKKRVCIKVVPLFENKAPIFFRFVDCSCFV